MALCLLECSFPYCSFGSKIVSFVVMTTFISFQSWIEEYWLYLLSLTFQLIICSNSIIILFSCRSIIGFSLSLKVYIVLNHNRYVNFTCQYQDISMQLYLFWPIVCYTKNVLHLIFCAGPKSNRLFELESIGLIADPSELKISHVWEFIA
jgi:hypothetical protein